MLQAEKTEKTKTEILKAAVELFGEKGFEATSIQEIADAAGYSVGSIYRHWKNKQHLLINVWNMYVTDYITEDIDLMPQMPTLDEMLDFLLARSEKFASNKYTHNLYPSNSIARTSEESAELNEIATEFQNMLFVLIKGIYPDASEARIRTVASVVHGVLNDDALKSTEFIVPHSNLDRKAFRECLMAIIKTCEIDN